MNRLPEAYRILEKTYGPQKCFLAHKNPFELLVCTILSAQCTDAKVNAVSPFLFERFPTPDLLADATIGEIEKIIKPIGLYHAKAKYIAHASEMICKKFAGAVPAEMDKLVSLPGVGRKTANVILGNAFGLPSFPVDTHVSRIAQRMGISENRDPAKIERYVCRNLAEELLTEFSHLLIVHGRKRCRARAPDCENCEIRSLCGYGKANDKKRKAK